MPGDLLSYLARLIGEEVPDGPQARTVADVLWMARHLPDADRAAADPGPWEPSADDSPESVPEPEPEQRAKPRPVPDPDPEPARPVAAEVELHPVPSPGLQAAAGGRAAVPVRVPALPALPDALSISRALRPLKRRIPTASNVVLSEEATAAAFGETDLILPAWRPSSERWLQADLVIDTSASMAIWQDTAAAFRSLLEHHGAFRDVHAWAVNADQQVRHLAPFGKSASGQPRMRHSPAELVDPGGRRAVLIVTDAVGTAWHDGTLTPLLAAWARSGPAAIIQVLPRRLWHRTGLDPVVVTGSFKPAARPPFQVARADDLWTGNPDGSRRADCWMPVLRLGSDWMGPWATMVSGVAERRTEVFAVPLDGGAVVPPERQAGQASARTSGCAGSGSRRHPRPPLSWRNISPRPP